MPAINQSRDCQPSCLIIGIIVTYQPDNEALSKLIQSLRSQLDLLLIVDNASSNLLLSDDQKQHVIKLDGNYGIAYAQNIGIEQAIQQGATHVLLMDQDSLPATDMVGQLLRALNSNKNVAATGPIYIDHRNNKKSFYVLEKRGLPHRWYADIGKDEPLREISFLIASGTLIKAAALKTIGGMRSNYFIDHVDTEWSFRARAMGFQLLAAPDAIMQHSLGDEVKTVWFFGERQISYHSPLRDYYMFRNTLLMLRDVQMTSIWRLHLLWRLVQFAGYFLVFSAKRGPRLHCMLLGIWHGLKNISGKLDIETGKCTSLPISSLDPSSGNLR